MDQIGDRSLLLVIEDRLKHFREGVTSPLLREVINGLPDGDLRDRLIAWTKCTQNADINRTELADMMAQLSEEAHTSSSELGEVGRLPYGITGRIVELEQFDGEPISSAVVLALAIRRLLLLEGMDTTFRLEAGGGVAS